MRAVVQSLGGASIGRGQRLLVLVGAGNLACCRRAAWMAALVLIPHYPAICGAWRQVLSKEKLLRRSEEASSLVVTFSLPKPHQGLKDVAHIGDGFVRGCEGYGDFLC